MESRHPLSRRRFAATVTGALSTGLLAGCAGGGESTPTATPPDDPADVTVEMGPGGRLVYDPAEVRVSAGDVVEWVAKSRGHNVSFRPQDGRPISIPDDADPFASYEDGRVADTTPTGGRYRHTFTVPGEYVYGCIPHLSANMVGRVVVD
ncbi:plastocyanin/azurin family copper-binding protein [Haloplanus sp. GCM10025708]